MKEAIFCYLYSRDLIFGHEHDQDFIYFHYKGHIRGQRSSMITSFRIYINFDFSKIFLNSNFSKTNGQFLLFLHILIAWSQKSSCQFIKDYFIEAFRCTFRPKLIINKYFSSSDITIYWSSFTKIYLNGFFFSKL